ncbi:MAG TPA: hypothetical protein VGF55_17640, partial [Gemmataceae bacterium]
MAGVRLPMAVCAVVSEVLRGSHNELDNLFLAAGAPGPPPNLSHATKWKIWLQRASNDPNVDSLALLGTLIEEFMDLPPAPSTDTAGELLGITPNPLVKYQQQRDRVTKILEEHGFRYFRGGRVLPTGEAQLMTDEKSTPIILRSEPQRPSTVEELLVTIIR